jgi:hypothetical protein
MDINITSAHDEIKGRFVDEENKPVPYQQVLLIYHPAEQNSFTSVAAMTGNDGAFSITSINFDVPGYYEVQIYGDVWKKNEVRINSQSPQPVQVSLRDRRSEDAKGIDKH